MHRQINLTWLFSKHHIAGEVIILTTKATRLELVQCLVQCLVYHKTKIIILLLKNEWQPSVIQFPHVLMHSLHNMSTAFLGFD